MNSRQIQDTLSLGEGQRIELKASTSNVDVLGAVVCGFLNTTGGYIICGIQEPGKVVGADASENAIARLEKQFHEGISPKSLISVQVQELEGKPVVVIEVPAGQDVPYAFRDIIYIRDGETTPDIGGSLGTAAVGRALAARLTQH